MEYHALVSANSRISRIQSYANITFSDKNGIPKKYKLNGDSRCLSHTRDKLARACIAYPNLKAAVIKRTHKAVLVQFRWFDIGYWPRNHPQLPQELYVLIADYTYGDF